MREPQDFPGTTAKRRIIFVQMSFGFPFSSAAAAADDDEVDDDDVDELSSKGRCVPCSAGSSSRGGGLSGAGRMDTVGRGVGAGSCVGGTVGAVVEMMGAVVAVFCIFDGETEAVTLYYSSPGW